MKKRKNQIFSQAMHIFPNFFFNFGRRPFLRSLFLGSIGCQMAKSNPILIFFNQTCPGNKKKFKKVELDLLVQVGQL